MPTFKLVHVGEERELSFLCDRCAMRSVELSFDTYNRPYKRAEHEPGQCSSCEGTGFEPSVPSTGLCHECSGSGVCPDCEGKATRLWNELPDEVRDELSSTWDVLGTPPATYGGAASLYRKW